MNCPLTLTDSAVRKIKEFVDQSEDSNSLRVGVQGGGCSGFQYHLSLANEAQDSDVVFQVDGVRMLIDPTSLLYLEGTHLDYVETLEGAGFKFDNPNVTSTCGCGSSFNA